MCNKLYKTRFLLLKAIICTICFLFNKLYFVKGMRSFLEVSTSTSSNFINKIIWLSALWKSVYITLTCGWWRWTSNMYEVRHIKLVTVDIFYISSCCYRNITEPYVFLSNLPKLQMIVMGILLHEASWK